MWVLEGEVIESGITGEGLREEGLSKLEREGCVRLRQERKRDLG